MNLGTHYRLNSSFVRSCTTPGVYIDGGLRLRVMSNGSRTWIMRITIHSHRRDISLGSLALLSLAEAREKAHEIRKAVSEGRDPAAERRIERLPLKLVEVVEIVDDRPTFEDCWRAFWKVKEPQLSNGKHRDPWVSTIPSAVSLSIESMASQQVFCDPGGI